jgi:predicted site-specific integrase-resolvase
MRAYGPTIRSPIWSGKSKCWSCIVPGEADDQVGRLVLAHKDRLLRFGAELVFAVCEAKNVEVVILNQGEDTDGRRSNCRLSAG